MVISGKGSTLDFYTALEIIKNKMGTTHVQRNSNPSNEGDRSTSLIRQDETTDNSTSEGCSSNNYLRDNT